MDISHRIHARKVVLSYFYQYYFFLSVTKNDSLITESLAIAHTFPGHEDFVEQKSELLQSLDGYNHENIDDMLIYLIDHMFDKWKGAIDTEYATKMMSAFGLYYDAVENIVDTYTTTFAFAQMDTIDKALFVLGYIEHKVLNTPKEVLINEIVELAKRYADDGSAKLLNGIMHKMMMS